MRPGRGAAVLAPDEDFFFPSLFLPLVARPPPPRSARAATSRRGDRRRARARAGPRARTRRAALAAVTAVRRGANEPPEARALGEAAAAGRTARATRHAAGAPSAAWREEESMLVMTFRTVMHWRSRRSWWVEGRAGDRLRERVTLRRATSRHWITPRAARGSPPPSNEIVFKYRVPNAHSTVRRARSFPSVDERSRRVARRSRTRGCLVRRRTRACVGRAFRRRGSGLEPTRHT